MSYTRYCFVNKQNDIKVLNICCKNTTHVIVVCALQGAVRSKVLVFSGGSGNYCAQKQAQTM